MAPPLSSSAPQKDFVRLQQSLPVPLSSQSLGIAHLCSVFMDFPNLDTSCKWNRTICGLSCLASFTKHPVFEVYPHWGLYQNSIPFDG